MRCFTFSIGIGGNKEKKGLSLSEEEQQNSTDKRTVFSNGFFEHGVVALLVHRRIKNSAVGEGVE